MILDGVFLLTQFKSFLLKRQTVSSTVQDLFGQLVLTQSIKKFQAFIEVESSTLSSLKRSVGPCPDLFQSAPTSRPIFVRFFIILSFRLRLRRRSVHVEDQTSSTIYQAYSHQVTLSVTFCQLTSRSQ